ncbi:EthD domain-containing protein [Vibrio sp. PP-XX7]
MFKTMHSTVRLAVWQKRTHSMVVSRDSVTELSWDSPEDMKANFADEYVRSKVGPDGKNFSDELCALSLVTSDVERHVAHPAQACGAKVMHFMRAIEGLELNEFFERWEKAHNRVVADNVIVAETVRRCVHHQQLPEFNPMLAYFGAKDMPIYEGVGSLWFDDVSSISAFRVYEKGLMAVNADPDTAFYNPEQSFFVYATEVPIYERHA